MLVSLFNSTTTNTCIQIVMLFLKDTVVIYNEYTRLCGHVSYLYCFIKRFEVTCTFLWTCLLRTHILFLFIIGENIQYMDHMHLLWIFILSITTLFTGISIQ